MFTSTINEKLEVLLSISWWQIHDFDWSGLKMSTWTTWGSIGHSSQYLCLLTTLMMKTRDHEQAYQLRKIWQIHFSADLLHMCDFFVPQLIDMLYKESRKRKKENVCVSTDTKKWRCLHHSKWCLVKQKMKKKKIHQLSGLSDSSANCKNVQRQPSNPQTRNFVSNF